MLMLIVLFLIRYPVKEMVQAMREMLGMSTSERLMIDIKQSVATIVDEYEVDDMYLRISKTGSLIFIEIDLIVAKNYRYDSILEQDLIREQIDAALEWLPQTKWLTVAFTANRKWAE
jgi:predicted Co/Zn/Cd cation transporter (cation efflux family)